MFSSTLSQFSTEKATWHLTHRADCCPNDLARSHMLCLHPLQATHPVERWITHSLVWPSRRFLSFSMNERRRIQPNGTSPLLSGERGNEARRRLSEVSQSQSNTDPVNQVLRVKLEKNERGVKVLEVPSYQYGL